MARKKKMEGEEATADENTPKETKEQKLVRLANRRVPQALKAIRRVGMLGAYKPTEQQTAKIMTELFDALNAAKVRMDGNDFVQSTFSL